MGERHWQLAVNPLSSVEQSSFEPHHGMTVIREPSERCHRHQVAAMSATDP